VRDGLRWTMWSERDRADEVEWMSAEKGKCAIEDDPFPRVVVEMILKPPTHSHG
jgi:hypothetical protein